MTASDYLEDEEIRCWCTLCLQSGVIGMQADLSDINLTPREVVERLDKYIVGQVNPQHQC